MSARIMLSLCLVIILFAATSASAKVSGREVEYRAGDTVLKGYLAENKALKGKRPAVLVVHEWWGHNEKFNLPLAYDKKADSDSWMQTKEFLKEIFAKKK